jgi:hypothetical protein
MVELAAPGFGDVWLGTSPVARRPNGLVALAIQYGHMRTAVSGSYASRGRDGIHELLDLETVRAVADTVAELHDDLAIGGGVSGSAARRAIKAASTAARRPRPELGSHRGLHPVSPDLTERDRIRTAMERILGGTAENF